MSPRDDGITVNAIFQSPLTQAAPKELSGLCAGQARRFHKTIDGYAPTPLVSLPALAGRLGIRGMYIKDESFRFGLNAFKSLGATWALARIICEKLGQDIHALDFSFFRQAGVQEKIGNITFVTATDGNHGRGVAWAARHLGCRAKVFMPAGTVPARVTTIEKEGAKVQVTDVNYDDTVRLAARAAEQNGWTLVQDTAWTGYETIPLWILQGYTTMADEALEQIRQENLSMPTHLFLQAGVGSMAAAVLGYYVNVLGRDCPATYILEPDRADCMYQSAMSGDGKPKAVSGALDTMMAGLACGEPNPFAWNILSDFSSGFISCSDRTAALGMTRLARPEPGDPVMISGESGAVGPGLAEAVMTDPRFDDLRDNLGFDQNTVLLCFSTEGDTDPVNYMKITGENQENQEYGHRPDGQV